jgi:hypothetical protein
VSGFFLVCSTQSHCFRRAQGLGQRVDIRRVGVLQAVLALGSPFLSDGTLTPFPMTRRISSDRGENSMAGVFIDRVSDTTVGRLAVVTFEDNYGGVRMALYTDEPLFSGEPLVDIIRRQLERVLEVLKHADRPDDDPTQPRQLRVTDRRADAPS